MRKGIVAVLVMSLLPAMAFAQEKPTAKEVQKVINYYMNGQDGGAVLVETKLCQEIVPEGPEKNNCAVDVGGRKLQLNEEAFIWMNFLVPADSQAKIYLSFSRNDRIRKTINFTLNGAFRFRTWKKLVTDSPGEWKVTIFQELYDRDIDLGSITYVVGETSADTSGENG